MDTTNNKAVRTGTASTPRTNYKRFPAYGKQLMDQRLAGQVPRNGVYLTFEWSLAKAFPRIVITNDLPIEDIDLRFLAGLDVTLVYRTKDADRVPELAAAILKIGPHILNAFNADIPQNAIIKDLAGEVMM